MDGNKCNERGYHEFRHSGNTTPYLPIKVCNVVCKDCQLKGADYLTEGWVHPE